MKVMNYLYSILLLDTPSVFHCGGGWMWLYGGENKMKLEIKIFISNTEICRSVMGYVQAVLQCMLLTKGLTN